ncbi:GntR family transcriptional regulator [Pseudaminobacter soli (ex Li et al. 2025)]|uniref:GntR family transcriptional regulator n=1 Tax=Pseudaminobacter soli (ex Li et al. 2025) TaxID=1295366 RepID=A0A2P7SND9_9HYPH|nr:GntR family transcriptional regulator [Mesorhizobium soli]PSJ63978.1 GntR family transcriptional regulator [Mesorhizobium soli]
MTLAEKAYDALRHDIIRGELAPGRPLRLADLSERYDMGFSPLREALNRLQAERLVTAESLRGFRVAPLSLDELHDATSLRILIETEALRASIRLGDDSWEAGIVSALYALNLQAGRTGPEADIWELEARHHAFHRALLAACNSPWTLEFVERLYVATERYRIPILLTAALPAGRDVQAEHSALAQATLERDADKAVALLREHYLRTVNDLAEAIRQNESDTPLAKAAR